MSATHVEYLWYWKTPYWELAVFNHVGVISMKWAAGFMHYYKRTVDMNTFNGVPGLYLEACFTSSFITQMIHITKSKAVILILQNKLINSTIFPLPQHSHVPVVMIMLCSDPMVIILVSKFWYFQWYLNVNKQSSTSETVLNTNTWPFGQPRTPVLWMDGCGISGVWVTQRTK